MIESVAQIRPSIGATYVSLLSHNLIAIRKSGLEKVLNSNGKNVPVLKLFDCHRLVEQFQPSTVPLFSYGQFKIFYGFYIFLIGVMSNNTHS